MSTDWNSRDPIFLQIRNRLASMILRGALGDGDQLPSVRQVAVDFTVNPITAMKSFQLLVDEGVVEKQRGKGMFVCKGAWGRLLRIERRRFLEDEWPEILGRIESLGLLAVDLPGLPSTRGGSSLLHEAGEAYTADSERLVPSDRAVGKSIPLQSGEEGEVESEERHPDESRLKEEKE
jgi:GntR family transcriptional regulator